jgi:hypothetical protein
MAFIIKSGPSKWDLMLALFDNNVLANPRTVEFEFVENHAPEKVIVMSVEREDHSGDSWNITGFIPASGVHSQRNVRGYYSTQTRRGDLTIEEDD